MKKTKSVVIEKLSDSSLDNVSGGFFSVLGEAVAIWLLKFSAAGLLTLGGAAGTIGCSIASAKQFSNSNLTAGSGLAAGAVASAGAAATGAVLLHKLFHGEDD